MKPAILGIAWFRPEHYDRLRSLFVDGNNLHDTYENWLKAAQNVADQAGRDGQAFQKVYIDPDTFPAWCAARGMDVDSKARISFAAWFVARRDA